MSCIYERKKTGSQVQQIRMEFSLWRFFTREIANYIWKCWWERKKIKRVKIVLLQQLWKYPSIFGTIFTIFLKIEIHSIEMLQKNYIAIFNTISRFHTIFLLFFSTFSLSLDEKKNGNPTINRKYFNGKSKRISHSSCSSIKIHVLLIACSLSGRLN